MTRRLLLAALVLLAACKPAIENPYPPEVVETFMASCREQRGATMASCSCSIDKLQRAFTLEEFRAFELRLAAGQIPKEMLDAVAECQGL